MNRKTKVIIVSIVALLIVMGGMVYVRRSQEASPIAIYDPKINPSDFSTLISNKYFSLPVGKTLIYEGQTSDGLERVEITIPGNTREIVGVQTLVYRDIVTLNGQLVEDTRDYLAQDGEGNVWYFGEEVDNFENGVLKDHAGSWIAGVDGAKPGIWMKANPEVGDTYRQEYYQGQAEDMADVVSVSETVTTKIATYQNCLKTYDYTPLDPDAREYKYYCPEVGGLVLEVNLTDGERVELTEVTDAWKNSVVSSDSELQAQAIRIQRLASEEYKAGDEEQLVYIKKVYDKDGRIYIDADNFRWLGSGSGTKTDGCVNASDFPDMVIPASEKRPECGPNGFLIVDDDQSIRTMELSPDVKIRMMDENYGSILSESVLSPREFLSGRNKFGKRFYVYGPDESYLEPYYVPFKLILNGGKIIYIHQVYTP